MSQAELASLAGGLDQSAIARIEQGRRTVSIEEAQEIATALGATVLDLLNEVGARGDRLFYARVMRPLRQLEAAIANSERALDGYRDGSLQEIVDRLSEGLSAYDGSALDPDLLIDSGQTFGQTSTLARALIDRHEVFASGLREALEGLTAPMVPSTPTTRDRTRTEARKVNRRQ